MKNYNIQPCKCYDSAQFNWAGNRGTTFASDLGPARDGPCWGRIYNDACDEGFLVVSARTNASVLFLIEGFDADREGDILCWHFVSGDLQGRTGNAGKYKITVFND